MNHKKKILIVDDERALAKALEIKLNHLGFEASIAWDGEECLEIAFREHPDLILMDIVMPKMDGITAIAKLRENEWGKNVPIIILTNLSSAEDATEAAKKEVYDYLVKSDWKLEDVVEKVREVLGE